MSKKRLLVCIFTPLLLAALGAILYWVRPVRLETSLYDLIGSAGKAIPAALRNPANDLVPVIVSASDCELAQSAATNLAARLEGATNFVAQVHSRVDGKEFNEFLDFCRVNASGLVAPSSRELLRTPEGRAQLARRALRSYLASPIPPLFSPAEDPFGLLNGYITSLPSTYAGWMPCHGLLSVQKDGKRNILLLVELRPEILTDTMRLIDFKEAFDAIRADVIAAPVSAVACGVPIHTATTAARCRAEMSALTLFSIAFIVLLSFMVFKSIKWIPYLFLTLVCASLAGSAALIACFGSVHALTFVLSTTVLGLVVDYAFHKLLATPENAPHVVRGLVVSCLTTEISLLPLIFSGIPVLRQAAVFLGVGLAASLLSVLYLYPAVAPKAAPMAVSSSRLRFRLPLFLPPFVLGVGVLIFKAQFATEPQAIYRPTPELAQAERLLAECSGLSGKSQGFWVVEGGDSEVGRAVPCPPFEKDVSLDSLLEKEESLNFTNSAPCLSHILPSLKVREETAKLVALLYKEQSAAQSAALGLPKLAPPLAPKAWEWDSLPSAASRAFVRGHALICTAPEPSPSAALLAGVGFWRPKELLSHILTQWTHLSAQALGVSLILILGVLIFVYRRAAGAMVGPSLFALVFTGALLVLKGEAINLFHLLAGFLLTGMSVDYTIFLRTGGRAAFRPALCSMLTSLAGFGALAFVSFPVVRAFGFVLGVGLPVAFLCAWASRPCESLNKGT